jgi:hypothetical protein
MLQEPQHLLLLVEHVGQLTRLAHEGEVVPHLRPIERHPEEEAQRRDRVHGRRVGTRLARVHLEPAQVPPPSRSPASGRETPKGPLTAQMRWVSARKMRADMSSIMRWRSGLMGLPLIRVSCLEVGVL